MRTRSSWDALLPKEEAEIAARYLVDIWNQLAQSQPEYIKYSEDEPKLTERLANYLVKLLADSGLTGKWTNEDPLAVYSDEGHLDDRIRRDITYFSNQSGDRLFLIFEFKKLSKSNLRTYRGLRGMQRFVDGNYGLKEPLAIMVALVKENRTAMIEALNRSLSQGGIQSELKMVHDGNGNYIRRPSNALNGIAEFDTEHRRPPEKAPPNGTTTLAHIFLGFSRP